MKKKITLIEGQRKAIYTSLEKEKAGNRDREINLEEELATLKEELVRSQATKETLLDKVPGGSSSDRLAYVNDVHGIKLFKLRRVLERLSPTSAVMSLDYKVTIN